MKALVIVDVQNDFCPGGALAVPGGDEVIAPINLMRGGYSLIVLTQDWHPQNHKSFAANHPGKKIGEHIELNGLSQILWPVHCVQNSVGSAFHPTLKIGPHDVIFKKGTDPEIDSYSGFYDNAHRKSTGLGEFLVDRKVTEITLCGLATDYCVLYSALDALSKGFKVDVPMAACRAVNLTPGDGDRAFDSMRKRGALVY